MFTTSNMKAIRNANLTVWQGTVNKTNTTFTPPSGSTLTFKANDGYIIDNISLTYWGVGGNASTPTNVVMTYSEDRKSASVVMASSGSDYIFVSATTSKAAPTPSTDMFTQADLDLIVSKNAKLKKGTNIISVPTAVKWGDTFTIVANEGYEIVSVTCKGANIVQNWTISSNKKTATFDSNYDGSQLSDLSVTTQVETVKGCFSTAMIQQINDNNCDLVYQGQIITTEKYASIGETYSIVCRPDWVFNTDPDAVGGYAVYGRYIDGSGAYVVDQWTVSEDKKTATKTLQASRNYATFAVKTDQDVLIDVIGGVNNVYKVDPDIMKDLTKQRFFMTNTGSGGEYVQYDYGQFIINLMQLPFSLPQSNIIGSEPIQLAKLETTVVAPMVNTDRINYDLGEINIVGNHGNLLDFSTKQAVLHLPFSDPIILDNQYVIDETIYINLEINLYTGTGTYNISSTKINEVILTKTVSLGVNVPLANFFSMDSKQILTSSLEWSGDNKLRIAYIELVDTNSDLNSGFFNTPIMDDVILSEVSGFYTATNVNLVLRATSSEKNQIQSILQGGVIYK